MKDKYVVVSKELIEKTLAQPWSPGKKELEPFKTFANEHELPFKIHEHPEEFGDAEAHLTQDDIWSVIEGTVEFIVGGKLKGDVWFKNDNSAEPRATEIEGGDRVVLQSGDCLVIPAEIPHMHRSKDKARSWIEKYPSK